MLTRFYCLALTGLSLVLSAPIAAQTVPGQSVCAPRPGLDLLHGTDERAWWNYLLIKNKRHTVTGDYLLLEYNASEHLTAWTDYPQTRYVTQAIGRNGSFLPVVYAKEKIAVHVCHLHFGDSLMMAVNPVGLPEGGADIRGATSNGLPANALPIVQAALDSLQSSGASGSNIQEGGLGYGTAAAFTPAATLGITPGSISTSSTTQTYTDATISVSAEQLAQAMHAFQRNAAATIAILQQLTQDNMRKNMRGGQSRGLPGSPEALQAESERLFQDIQDTRMKDPDDPAAFDEYVSRVQAFAGELINLNASLSASGLGARAVILQASYANIRGVLDVVNSIIRTDEGFTCLPIEETAADSLTCHHWELQAFRRYQRDYYDRLRTLNDTGSITPDDVFDQLENLKEQLRTLDSNTGQVFRAMNTWYESSNAEQTDFVTPVAGNALERISIVVQRTFVPFTLTGQSSLPISLPLSPASGAAGPANTSGTAAITPPHTVKTILVEVHRRANFNLVGGVMLIHVPTHNYGLQAALTPNSTTPVVPVTTPPTPQPPFIAPATCGGVSSNLSVSGASGTATYYCVTTIQKTDWQVAGMSGVAWFPFGRDYFPHGSGLHVSPHDLWPSFLIATSITSIGNAVGAINMEPISGIDLFAGIGSAHRIDLPSSLSNPFTTPLYPNSTATPSLQTNTTVHAGFTAGIGLDLSVFIGLFSKTSSASLP
jgi:hypothetical protein